MKNLNYSPTTLNVTQAANAACVNADWSPPRKQPTPRLAALLFALTLTTTAHCQTLYRCTDGAGKVTFTDAECSGTRTPIKANPGTIGDGGATAAKRELALGEAQNAIDRARRRYNDAVDNERRLRASLDNNDIDRQSEIDAILKEREYCRFTKIPTPRCQEIDAMKQRDIDAKWHNAWMTTHRNWRAALQEKTESSLEFRRIAGRSPD